MHWIEMDFPPRTAHAAAESDQDRYGRWERGHDLGGLRLYLDSISIRQSGRYRRYSIADIVRLHVLAGLTESLKITPTVAVTLSNKLNDAIGAAVNLLVPQFEAKGDNAQSHHFPQEFVAVWPDPKNKDGFDGGWFHGPAELAGLSGTKQFREASAVLVVDVGGHVDAVLRNLGLLPKMKEESE